MYNANHHGWQTEDRETLIQAVFRCRGRTKEPYLLYTPMRWESRAECKYSLPPENIFRSRQNHAKASSSAIPPITAEEEAAPTIKAPIFCPAQNGGEG